MLLFDPPVQTFAEAGRQLAGLVVASRRIGRHHDRPEVAEIELVEVGEGGIGPVAPFGGAQAGEEPLGDGHQGLRLDLGPTLGLRLLVLLLDGLAHGGNAAAQHLLGDGTLLLGQLGEDRRPVVAERTEALRLGLLGQGSGTRAPLAAGAGATLLPFTPVTFVTPAALTAALTVGTVAAVAIAPRTAPVTVAAASTTALRGEGGGDELVVAERRGQQLDALGLLAGALGRQHADDLDAVDLELGIGAHDVADLRPVEQQGPVEGALGLTCAGGAPGPGPVVALAGELDLDASRHGGRR